MDERITLLCMVQLPTNLGYRTFRLGHKVEGRTCGPAPASCLPLLDLTARVLDGLSNVGEFCYRCQREWCRFWCLIKRQGQEVLCERSWFL